MTFNIDICTTNINSVFCIVTITTNYCLVDLNIISTRSCAMRKDILSSIYYKYSTCTTELNPDQMYSTKGFSVSIAVTELN